MRIKMGNVFKEITTRPKIRSITPEGRQCVFNAARKSRTLRRALAGP